VVGGALGVRQVGVGWHADVSTQPQRGARPRRPQALRLARVLLWRMREGARPSRLLRHLPVSHDLDERAQAFGIVFNY